MEDIDDIQRLAPQKLVGRFGRSPILWCVVIALAAHVVLIGGTSIDYIYYNWVDPEAGRLRKEQEKAGAKPKGADAPAPSPAEDGGKAKAPQPTGKELLDAHKDKPVVKQITETPDPDEIPKDPDGLDISLDEIDSR
jgi:hypothetical protein